MPTGIVAISLAASLTAQQVAAAESASAESGTFLEEVIVTANKRSENLQSVPISIVAVSADQLAASGVIGTEDLSVRISGLQIQKGGANFSPYIRGIGTTASGAGNENSVATYVDGVLLSSYQGGFLALNNIQQIEVDKGPQGTLFGRNTTGGVISITTKTPSQELQGNLEAGYGNFDTLTARGYVTGGVTDSLAADLAVYYSDQSEGFGRNLFTGNDVYTSESLALRSKWVLSAGEDDELTFAVDYQQIKSTPNAEVILEGSWTNWGTGDTLASERPDLAPYVEAGALSPNFVAGDPMSRPGGPFDISVVIDPRDDIEQSGASLKWQHQFGFGRGLSVSAYRDANVKLTWSPNPVPVPQQVAGWQEQNEAFTQELQLSALEGSAVQWVGGVFYLHGTVSYDDPFFFIQGTSVAPLQRVNFFGEQTTDSIAGYGQVTTPIATDTNVTVGLRYTRDEKSIIGSTHLQLASDPTAPPYVGYEPPPDAINLPPVNLTDASDTFEKFTYRIALDHQFTPDLLGYVSYNRGFKSGSYNMIPPGGPDATAVEPEVLDAYELGFKSELFDNRLRANVALFYYKWSQMQVTVFNNTTAVTENAAEAEMYGVDVDLLARVTDGLQLSAGVSVLDDEFTDYPSAQFNIAQSEEQGGGTIGITGSANGNKLPYAPDISFNVAADYSVALPAGALGFNLSYYYNDGFFTTADNLLGQESYQLLNSQLQWTLPDNRTKLSIWGRNLLDEEYATQVRNGTNPGGYQVQTMAAPRTYGVSVQYDF